MPFNLGERTLTINVKNKNIQKPENTVFSVKDYKGTDLYKGTYFIPDIRKIDSKESIDLNFNNLHCNYYVSLKINPNNYAKNIDISYWIGTNLKCLIKITPESVKKEMKISVKQQSQVIQNISLNDLWFQHYWWIFILWLFLIIWIGINYINKKWLLLNTKNK